MFSSISEATKATEELPQHLQRPAVDINILDGTNRDQDVFFQDDDLIASIRKARTEETKWRKID